ncbi:MAG: hypothetical protein R2854_28275 [Caldilineaceae bacterium]
MQRRQVDDVGDALRAHAVHHREAIGDVAALEVDGGEFVRRHDQFQTAAIGAQVKGDHLRTVPHQRA